MFDPDNISQNIDNIGVEETAKNLSKEQITQDYVKENIGKNRRCLYVDV